MPRGSHTRDRRVTAREVLLALCTAAGAIFSTYQASQVDRATDLRLTAIQGLASALADCERRSDMP